jgi:Glyoxalase-like domain
MLPVPRVLLCSAALLLSLPYRPASAPRPMVELDHVFVLVPTRGGPEIAALRSAGFYVDTVPARHTGLGTASVSVYFENAYFELLWLDPAVEVAPEWKRRAETLARATDWRRGRASPFGIGLRRVPGFTSPLPVPVRLDSAAYLKPGEAFEELNQPADSLAAELFVLPPSRAVPTWIERAKTRHPELFRHPNRGRRLTRMRLSGRPEQEPAALAALEPGGIERARSDSVLLELELDQGARRERVDLRPLLPVVILR